MAQKFSLPEEVTPTTPLRLSVAAALAVPDASLTTSGRRLVARNRGQTGNELVRGTTLATKGANPDYCR